MVTAPVYNVAYASPYMPSASVGVLRFGKDTTLDPVKGPIQTNLFAPRPYSQDGMNRFVIVGDTGDETEGALVAQQMLTTFKQKPFKTVLLLGDHVYEDSSVRGTLPRDGHPDLFKDRIYDPYHALLEEEVRFFPLVGNHDVQDGLDYEDAQLLYLGAEKSGEPQRFYSFRVGPVEFFALDTTVFWPEYDACYTQGSSPEKAQRIKQAQLDWFENALQASTADFKVVFGHYPFYEYTDNQVRQALGQKLRDELDWERLSRTYGANLYLSAHNHLYERHQQQGVHYLVSGGGGGNIYPAPTTLPNYPTDKLITKHHFVLFEIHDDHLNFEAIDKFGNVIDTGTIEKPLLQP